MQLIYWSAWQQSHDIYKHFKREHTLVFIQKMWTDVNKEHNEHNIKNEITHIRFGVA
jgi:hypothetical protein